MSTGSATQIEFPREPALCGVGTVEVGWIDYNGHMNVGFYGLAFDQLQERFYEEALNLGESYSKTSGMGPFALQTNLHFLDELRVGQRFEVRLQLIDCDAKRWHVFSTMINLETGSRAATNEQISMNVDHATRRSAPLPEAQQARLAALRAAHAELPRPAELGAPLGIRRRTSEA